MQYVVGIVIVSLFIICMWGIVDAINQINKLK